MNVHSTRSDRRGQSKIHKTIKILRSIFFLFSISAIGVVSLEGCAQRAAFSESSQEGYHEFKIDESAYKRAREILEKYPEEDLLPPGQKTPSPNDGSGNTDGSVGSDNEDSEDLDEAVGSIPEAEANELMSFVDAATLEMVQESPVTPDKKKEPGQPEPSLRLCDGDGVEVKTSRYHENVKDECLLPKMKLASDLFKIRYTFVRCIFEQENRQRDRLAHNQNGNGLAQIVNVTMKEINKRWNNEDTLSGVFKQCLTQTSNREEQYLQSVHQLEVPPRYNKTDILNEASTRPPTTRVNPLYRDDSVCLGLMTMGIKVQEAQSRRQKREISDSELARRYNGSKIQQRYARAVVKCVDRYSRGANLLVSQ